MINEVQPGHYMELTTILGVLLAVLQLVIIAFCKVLWSNFQEVKRRGETTAAEVAQLKSGCAKELAQFKLDCAEKYSTKEDIEYWSKRDTIGLLEKKLIDQDVLDEVQLDEINGEAKETVNEAVKFADESDEPPIEELYTDVYAGEDEYLGEE